MRFSIFGMVVLAVVLSSGVSAQAADWKLVWSDEFEQTGLPDETKWGYEQGFVRNHEAQYYTRARKENAHVKNGTLVITARKESYKNARFDSQHQTDWRRSQEYAQYTSACLETKEKAAWRYGRIEVRAKLPSGRGTWPAIWMLGVDKQRVGWPACGEIDIMENVGFAPDVIHANIHTKAYNHTKGNGKGSKITIHKPYEDFHVYAVEWTSQKMDFFVDDQNYFSYENEGTGRDAWPFDQPHYLILNIAVGGAWGGQQGIDDTIFPQEMLVDYVRVYQKQD